MSAKAAMLPQVPTANGGPGSARTARRSSATAPRVVIATSSSSPGLASTRAPGAAVRRRFPAARRRLAAAWPGFDAGAAAPAAGRITASA
jgi:hypothetical protein